MQGRYGDRFVLRRAVALRALQIYHRDVANFAVLFPCCLCILSGIGCVANPDGEPCTMPVPVDQSIKQSTAIWLKHPSPYDVVRSDTLEPAAVAVYVAGRGGLEGKGVMPWLVLAVWSDGRIISSADRLTGGQPYFESRVDPQAVADLLQTLTAIALKSGVASVSYAGPPDHATTVIQGRTADGRIYELSSWHELAEESGEWIVTERGSVKLEPGHSPQQVLHDNSSEQYTKFRDLWSTVRRTINDASPQSKAQPAPQGTVRFVPMPPHD